MLALAHTMQVADATIFYSRRYQLNIIMDHKLITTWRNTQSRIIMDVLTAVSHATHQQQEMSDLTGLECKVRFIIDQHDSCYSCYCFSRTQSSRSWLYYRSNQCPRLKRRTLALGMNYWQTSTLPSLVITWRLRPSRRSLHRLKTSYTLEFHVHHPWQLYNIDNLLIRFIFRIVDTPHRKQIGRNTPSSTRTSRSCRSCLSSISHC